MHGFAVGEMLAGRFTREEDVVRGEMVAVQVGWGYIDGGRESGSRTYQKNMKRAIRQFHDGMVTLLTAQGIVKKVSA